MSDRAKKIKLMGEKEDWQGIVDSFFEKKPLRSEYAEIGRLFINALRRKGFFDEANLLEHKISTFRDEAELTQIARMVFCKKFHTDFDSNGLIEYFLHKIGKKHVGAWVDFIKLLAIDGSYQEFKSYQRKYNFNNDFVTYKKVFIAGFGRSGTGALRSFLNEFKEIFEVPGSEITVISGRRGLSSLFLSADLIDFKEKYLDFFVVNALGLSELNDYSDSKELQKSRIILREVNEIEFLEAFFHLYFNISFSGCFSSSVVKKYSQDFLNRYIGSLKKVDEDSVVLFNNVVNAHCLWMMNLVDNYFCFPVSRDPRSQYASFVSTSKPNFSIKGFIGFYRKGENLYREGVESLGEDKDRVIRIKFENLIFHESERLRVAFLLGLNNEKASRFTLLKPEESIANVFLHTSDEFFNRKKDFEILEKELGDYCIIIK